MKFLLLGRLLFNLANAATPAWVSANFLARYPPAAHPRHRVGQRGQHRDRGIRRHQWFRGEVLARWPDTALLPAPARHGRSRHHG